MSLKYELENLDGVDESIQSFYKQDGDVYRLQVDGIEDTGELKRAYERVKNERTQLKDQISDWKNKYETTDEKLREALASGNNEEKIESLRTSYEDKLNRIAKEKDDELSSRDRFIEKIMIENKAQEIAGSLAVKGAEKLLIPLIAPRLSLERNGDDYSTVVLGGDGKPSALTLDDLKKEIASDPACSHVIAGSQATGGGASGGNYGGDAASKKGNIGGSKDERVAAFRQRFPELSQ